MTTADDGAASERPDMVMCTYAATPRSSRWPPVVYADLLAAFRVHGYGPAAARAHAAADACTPDVPPDVLLRVAALSAAHAERVRAHLGLTAQELAGALAEPRRGA